MPNKQLVFSDQQGDQFFLFGAVFIGASLIWFLVRMPLPGLAFIIGGLGVMLFSSNLTITADRPTRLLRLEYRSRFFHSIKEIPFDDIADIRLETARGKGAHKNYRVIAILNNGKKIPFHTFFTSGGRLEKQEAAKLHAFILGKTQPGEDLE